MKKKNLFAAVLVMALTLPVLPAAEMSPSLSTKVDPQPATSTASATPSTTQDQQSAAAQTETKARNRSYERETRPRHRSKISKKEWVFLGAIAGTSMGIGAIAAGGEGLAIGAIVGGWGAYLGHRVWKWVR